MWKPLHVCTLILTDHYENEGAQTGTVDSIDGFIEINLSECYC